MITSEPITLANVKRLESTYKAFQKTAEAKYRWDMAAVDFDTFQLAIGQGVLEGYLILDPNRSQEPAGFALYKIEEHGAIEINLIHMEDWAPKKSTLDFFLRQFIPDMLKRPDWTVMSYAMLGAQEDYIINITWFGFKPVGQSIVRFNFLDQLALQVFKNQEDMPALPEGYTLTAWDEQYADQTAQVIYEAFHTKSDALWDPRFATRPGADEVIELIRSNAMGVHLKQCTQLLLKEVEGSQQVVGFCFLVQSDTTQSNIPLIGILPSEKRKGFGNQLLYKTIFTCMGEMLQGKLGMTEINATVDTDNFPALQMYRRMGFQEDYNYPHVYLTREKAATLKPGEWCTTPPA